MGFWIQAGDPVTLDVGRTVEDFSDAISLLYPAETEYLILSWNLVPVAVGYGEDLYVFAYDLIELLEHLGRADFSEYCLSTGSSSFFTRWLIRAEGDGLVIDSHWDNVIGNYEHLLNERSRLTVPRADFVAEWTKVIRRVVQDVIARSVRMTDDDLFVRAKALLGKPMD